ncbi:MAG: hypothetical protein ACI9MR_000618 [Myxococcota bacterium]|jgi:hypothetical protein
MRHLNQTLSLSRRVAVFCIVATLSLAGCGDDVGAPDSLLLSITSDAATGGQSLDSLRILFERDGVRFPADATAPLFNLTLGPGMDPTVGPVIVAVEYRTETFAGSNVTVSVVARGGDTPLTRFEGSVDLDRNSVVSVHLAALPLDCDADGDGFLDCGVAGCCASGSVFADCDPNDANANPWGTEPTCEPCSDTVDQDCSGGDQPCVDMDTDGLADCSPDDCDPTDDTVGKGLPELCDERDNNCDGQTDEGLTLIEAGANLALGAACGLGACEGGTVVCGVGTVACSTDNMRAADDLCGDAVDNDCDGDVDEGCDGDLDGDGFSIPEDCNDGDSGVFPDRADEPCCVAAAQGDPAREAACDLDCSGDVVFCDAADADGDGVVVGDCDPDDATIYPGAPERCGDGIDQDCFAGDLPCDGLTDVDGDGWPASIDCRDDEAAINPGAIEVCDGVDNDCNGLVDDGNPDTAAVCGSDVGNCTLGAEVCINSVVDGNAVVGMVDCVGNTEPAAEICDGVDNDCDAAVDEDFQYEAAAIGAPCEGVGACGAGFVECATSQDAATCSSNADGSESESTPEVCDTVDNDCDGELNNAVTDPSTCSKEGVCGTNAALIGETCEADGLWTCDYANVPGYEEEAETLCDTLDNDCDGAVDEGLGVDFFAACDGDDADVCATGAYECVPGDPTAAPRCNEDGTNTIAEICDGEDNDCDGATDEDFTDGTITLAGAAFADDNGKSLGAVCGTGACGVGAVMCVQGGLGCVTPTPAREEVCNLSDDDCDGEINERFLVGGDVTFDGGPNPGDAGLVLGATCGTGECFNGRVVCASLTTLTCDSLSNVETEVCDAVDNDCDGQINERFKAGGDVTFDGGPNPGDAGLVLGATCGTGACASGEVVCADLNTLTCDSLGLVEAEACSGGDEDCDGLVDENFVAGPQNTVTYAGGPFAGDAGLTLGQPCGTGPCSGGDVICDGEGTLTCSSLGMAVDESCDEADNDCNGAIDEPFVDGTTPLTGAAFPSDNGAVKGASCGAGLCVEAGLGTVGCDVGSGALICSTDANEVLEICDGLDNSCDGQTDGGEPDFDSDMVADCVDNCVSVANPDQTDDNGNGVGDACENCAQPSPFDVCGDCVDNDCSGVADDIDCVYGRYVAVRANAQGLGTTQAVAIFIDHAFLVSTGRSTPGGDDIRFYYDDGSGEVEIPRTLAAGRQWNTDETAIFFPVQAPVVADDTVLSYRMYTGVTAGEPLRNIGAATAATAGSFAYVGAREPTGCVLNDTGVVVRYFFDDMSGTVAADVVAAALDLARVVVGGQPLFANIAGNETLYFDNGGADGVAIANFDGTKIDQGGGAFELNNRGQFTVELVAEAYEPGANGTVLFELQRGNNTREVVLRASSSHMDAVIGGPVRARWNFNVESAGRAVYHLVVDASLAEDQRVRLYRDGHRMAEAGGNTALPSNFELNLPNGHIAFGNGVDGGASLNGFMYYGAVYRDALTAQEVTENTSRLSANDDEITAP